jgi:hypothetical protein
MRIPLHCKHLQTYETNSTTAPAGSCHVYPPIQAEEVDQQQHPHEYGHGQDKVQGRSQVRGSIGLQQLDQPAGQRGIYALVLVGNGQPAARATTLVLVCLRV